MSLTGAILLTLLASSLARIGMVLLKRTMARNRRHMIEAVVGSWPAMLGLVLQAVAIWLFTLAIESPQAPISILQPMRAFGIIVMAFLAVIFLHERLSPWEWTGLAVCIAGVALLGISCQIAPLTAPGAIDRTRLLALVGTCAVCALLVLGVRGMLPHASFEVLSGCVAGILLGIGYLHAKVFFLAWRENSAMLLVLSAAMTPVGLIGGLVVLLSSFRWARATIVTTTNTLVNQTVVILGGSFCLGEDFPSEPLPLYARLAGLAAVLTGIAMLARFHGGVRAERRL